VTALIDKPPKLNEQAFLRVKPEQYSSFADPIFLWHGGYKVKQEKL